MSETVTEHSQLRKDAVCLWVFDKKGLGRRV